MNRHIGKYLKKYRLLHRLENNHFCSNTFLRNKTKSKLRFSRFHFRR